MEYPKNYSWSASTSIYPVNGTTTLIVAVNGLVFLYFGWETHETYKTWINLSWLNHSTNRLRGINFLFSKDYWLLCLNHYKYTERKITTMCSPEQKGTFLISVRFHITSVCPKPRTIPMTVINKTMKTRLQTIERRVSASIH